MGTRWRDVKWICFGIHTPSFQVLKLTQSQEHRHHRHLHHLSKLARFLNLVLHWIMYLYRPSLHSLRVSSCTPAENGPSYRLIVASEKKRETSSRQRKRKKQSWWFWGLCSFDWSENIENLAYWVSSNHCALAGYLTYEYRHPSSRTPVPPITRALRAALYGATVFLSFFLMLIFMTYNVRSHFTSAFAFHFLMKLSIGLSHRSRSYWSVSWALYLWIYYQRWRYLGRLFRG